VRYEGLGWYEANDGLICGWYEFWTWKGFERWNGFAFIVMEDDMRLIFFISF
jgi:hypothetical protein